MKTILLLSVGTRNKIVEYFKNAFQEEGLVLAADASPLAPALYAADKYFIVPRIDDSDYLDRVLSICEAENVDGILSLIDPELEILAKNQELFSNKGCQVIGSSWELCRRALNKMEMHKWLRANGYKSARSYASISHFEADRNEGVIDFPVYVKPIGGSASLLVSKADDMDTLRFMFSRSEQLMIQEYMNGTEYGADVYIDMISGEVVSVFVKQKLLMRSGETDKGVSYKNDALFELIVDFVQKSGFRGQIDIDIFEVDGEYYISEVNPRFGGGYPHAFECGCDHMSMILNNLKGNLNRPAIGMYDEGITMMKYIDLICMRQEQEAR